MEMGKRYMCFLRVSRFRVEPFVNAKVVALSTTWRFATKCSINLFLAYYNFFSFHREGVLHSLLLANLAEIGIVSVEFIIAIPPSP
jgi:hypothetical protein